MILEQIVSLIASILVCFFAAARLSELKRERFEAMRGAHACRFVLEVVGLVIVAAGAAGVAGEWFLEGMELHADTIVMVGAALFGAGVSPWRQAAATAAHEVHEFAGHIHDDALELLHRERG